MEIEKTYTKLNLPNPLQTLRTIFDHSEMIRYLITSQLKQSHQNLILGYIWWIINPIFSVGIYWLLISVIFNSGREYYPLFLACAILPWKSFAVSVSQSITCISSQSKIIKQISFPKGVFPVSVVLVNTIDLLISMVVLIGIALFYGIMPDINIIYLPLIVLVQILFTLGIAFLLSVIGLFFLDISNMLQFILRIWLYVSPSLYGLERVPERFRDIFMLNPFAPIFISYRNVIMYGKAPDFNNLIIAFFISLLILFVSLFIFAKIEYKIAKIV